MLASATSLWMVYLSRIIDGVTAGNLSLAQAYIADNTPPEYQDRRDWEEIRAWAQGVAGR